jgi:hypothetical protein
MNTCDTMELRPVDVTTAFELRKRFRELYGEPARQG